MQKRCYSRYMSKGFAILPIIIVVALVLGGGVFLYSQNPSIKQGERQVKNSSEQVESGSTSEIFWEKDSGARVEGGSVPYIHKLKDGKVRLYYCGNGGIFSAISQDGLTFTKEQGVRVDAGGGFELIVCDPTIVDLPDGKMMMYYKGASSMNPGPGQSIHKIFSAISSDGLTFTKESGLRVANLVDPALVKIGSRYLLFAASIDERFAKIPKGIYYLQSSDGLEFGEPTAVFQEDNVYDPSVLKVDDSTVRVFYGKVVPPKLPAVESHTGQIAK